MFHFWNKVLVTEPGACCLARLAGQQVPRLCLSLLHPEWARVGLHILLFGHSVLSTYYVPCREAPCSLSRHAVVARGGHGLTSWEHAHCATVWKVLA